jgi:hypothetical protein
MYPSKMGKMGEMEFVKTHLDPGWDTDPEVHLAYLKAIMQATEGIVSTIPDNMIDTTLYGSRMNNKLFNASKELLFPLTGPVRYEGGLGETMNRDNLMIELPCKPPKSEYPTTVNLWKALEDKQLPSGHLLSGENCIMLLNFVDLVTHACFCEDEKGNVVWYDTFYRDVTQKNLILSSTSTLRGLRITHLRLIRFVEKCWKFNKQTEAHSARRFKNEQKKQCV